MSYLVLNLLYSNETVLIEPGDLVDFTELEFGNLGKKEVNNFLLVPFNNMDETYKGKLLETHYSNGNYESDNMVLIEDINNKIILPTLNSLTLDLDNKYKLNIQDKTQELINNNSQYSNLVNSLSDIFLSNPTLTQDYILSTNTQAMMLNDTINYIFSNFTQDITNTYADNRRVIIEYAMLNNDTLLSAQEQIKNITEVKNFKRFNLPISNLVNWSGSFDVSKALDNNSNYQPFIEKDNSTIIDFSEKVGICKDKHKNSFRYKANKILG